MGRMGGLRVVVRGLLARPGLSLAAAATLGLGIGANVGLFSVVHAVLLRPLPFAEPEALVQLWESDPRRPVRSASPANFLDLRRASETLGEMAAYHTSIRTLSAGDRSLRVQATSVSGNFFQTLGVQAAQGSTFGPEPAEAGARLAVLSHGLWVRVAGGDPAVVGRTLELDGEPFRVTGIMPPEMAFPRGVELWTAASQDIPWTSFGGDADLTAVRDAWYFRVVARLAAGVEGADAISEMEALAARLSADWPRVNEGLRIRLVPLREELVGDDRGRLLLLLGATVLLLLVACVNVAGLLMVRGEGRRRELALRRALGAGAGRITGLVLLESLVLAGAGTVVGVVMAWAAVSSIGSVVDGVLPPGVAVTLDSGVLGYACALALGVAALFGAVPAWRSGRVAPRVALSGGEVERRRSLASEPGSALVVVEMALATVLVMGAILALRSVVALNQVDPGFRGDGLVLASVARPGGQPADAGNALAGHRTLVERVAALPGVEAVGLGQHGPLELGPGAGVRRFDGGQASWARQDLPSTRWQVVSPGWLGALGVRVVEGRGLLSSDDGGAEPVGVVNQAFVREVFGGESPVGHRIHTGLDGRESEGAGGLRWVRVVGVVSDTRNRGPAIPPEPVLFRPLAQGGPGFPGDALVVALRGDGDPGTLVPALRAAVEEVQPGSVVYDIRAGEELAAPYTASSRLLLGLLGAFAGLALALGAVGVYGVTAYAVGRRSRELGVRMALGADPGRLRRAVLVQGLRPALVGLGGGLALAAVAGGLLRHHLFGVGPLDPLSWAAVGVVLMAASAVAVSIPARRASRVDPAETMRAS